METKDYKKLICLDCKKKDTCKKDKMIKKTKNGVTVSKCPNYVSNYEKKSGFIYKNQLFQY